MTLSRKNNQAQSGAPVTMRDVADYAGVSRQTVSGVLGRNTHLYNEQTRQRVLEAVEALGYRPNSSALAIKTGSFGAVGLLLSTVGVRSLMSVYLLSSVQDELALHDLNLLLSRQPDQTLDDQETLPRLLREWSVDGLLINYTVSPPHGLEELIAKHRIPAIWINIKRPFDCVYHDDFLLGRKATEYLLGLGHTRIGYADYTTSPHYSAVDRRNAYLTVMRENSLDPILCCSSEHIVLEQYAAYSRTWLQNPNRPTALVTYNGTHATSVLYAAAQIGLKVPEDLSVIAINEEIPRDCGVPTTTAVLEDEALGRLAVRNLLTKIQSPGQLLEPRAQGGVVVEGATTAPPK